MASEPPEAYVWAWLPGATDPVVAGRLRDIGTTVTFTYGLSYLELAEAVPLYLPELPLSRGPISPSGRSTIAGCIDDAGPDSWGQRVIEHRLLTQGAPEPWGLDASRSLGWSPLTYLLASDSDRTGALDFQASATHYVPRTGGGTLDELANAAARLEAGDPFSPALERALLRGSSIGGARPKALLDDQGRKLIAKFSSATDVFPVVKAEALAMELGRRVGLHVAPTELTSSMGRDVLLVERFDRGPGGDRKMMVSALTVLGLAEVEARYATYHDLADVIAERFANPSRSLHELFARIVFNIATGNTDDHARNHAAFWDGKAHQLSLTPAYDICPYPRAGQTAEQIMAIGRDGSKASQFATCVAAADVYGLSTADARDIVDHQVTTIRREWAEAADVARLTEADKTRMWGRDILNPYAFFDEP